MEERPLILITGANGQLGQAFKFLQPQFQDFDILWMDRSQLDITKAADVRKTLESVMPDVVINCAAYTNVEKAEDEAEMAMLQNGTAPAFLAVACSLTGARLIHLSTDYVFEGSKQTPYLESDPIGPLSVYGQSKLAGERAIHSAGGDYWIFRVAWLYSPFAHNFYKTMIKLAQEKPELKVVSDQFGAPTNALILAKDILELCAKSFFDDQFDMPFGIYHYAHSGITTWHGFAQEIMKAKGVEIPVIPVSSEQFPTKAKRPNFSCLDASLFYHSTGLKSITWQAALQECIKTHERILTSQV
jgi:dTDP-4-dehydrorhamnose reductase